MRISSAEREIIRREAKHIFGPAARVLLFGSRVDDSKKGGDIDLLIEVEQLTDTVKKRMMLMTELQFKLGERKIDIITASPGGMETDSLIVKIARGTGVEL